MIIRRRAVLDTQNPPGTISNPISLEDFIKEELKRDPDVLDPPKPESPEDAYVRGFNDGVKEGFERGITWMRGK